MRLAQWRGRCVRARRGFYALPLLPDGEGNWDAVRVIEVGDPGLRRKETGFHIPVVSAFLLTLTGIGDTRVAAAPARAASRQLRSRGRPPGLARPRPGLLRLGPGPGRSCLAFNLPH